MNKQIARKYNVSDANFLEHGRTKTGNLQNNLTDFSAVDKSIDQTFVDALKALINNAEAVESDEVISDQQSQLTEAVNNKRKECIEHFKLIKYFAAKAFPGQQAVLNEFGEDDFSDKKEKNPEMIMFMKNLCGVAAKYRPQLLAADATEAQLDLTQSLYDELLQANSEKDLFISNRPVKTAARIEALNAIYDKLQVINELAKIIYADKLQMLKLFLMPHGKSTKKDSSVSVPPKENLIVFEEGINEGVFIKVENTGETELIFAVSGTHDDTPHEKACTLPAGEDEIVRAEDIMTDTAGMLLVYNETETEGKFKASLLE